MKKVRKNLTMSSELAEWFEEKATKLGVTQSSMMVMALGDYQKQELAVSMMANFDYVMEELGQLKTNIDK